MNGLFLLKARFDSRRDAHVTGTVSFICICMTYLTKKERGKAKKRGVRATDSYATVSAVGVRSTMHRGGIFINAYVNDVRPRLFTAHMYMFMTRLRHI